MRLVPLAAGALVGLLAACGDDGTSAPTDAGTEADAFTPPTDAAIDAPPPRPCPPIPDVAPPSMPEELVVPTWMMATVGASGADPVLDRIETGTFELPAEGIDGDGVDWFPLPSGEDGLIDNGLGGIFYAVARIDVPEGMHAYARVDAALAVYVNGAPQPGDPYRSRRMRVPLATEPGQNLVAVRAFGQVGRPDPEVQVYLTPDEIVFNEEDLTVPDVRVGEVPEQEWLGAPVLNTTDRALVDVTARVVESDDFEETVVTLPALGPASVTKVPFELRAKHAFDAADAMVPVTLRIESCSLDASYETTIELTTVAADAPFRGTFRSTTDGSAQYYGALPPASFDPMRDYALVLSLHGASVEAIGQARAYSSRDWAWIVAATNRRPFGFDWEEWGRRDALEVLAEAKRVFRIDETRVYLTGHSMGGHGTWHVGTLYPTLFATLGPSAGWSSFNSYTGATIPTGPVGRARAHSNTLDYLPNLARRGVYIIHGSADDNVPVREGRDMYSAVQMVTGDAVYHEEPGAGHWWDGEVAPGADCVDWPPLFDFMQARTLDPTELEFEFRTPGPWVSARHSYATIVSVEDPMADAVIASVQSGAGEVTLTTTNVRALAIDGAALGARGIATIVVDGTSMAVPTGELSVGPTTGKRYDRSGPLNQAFHRPFCFVYDDAGHPAYRRYAAHLISTWAIIGNGLACAVPLSAVGGDLLDMNLIWLGVPEASIPGPPESPFDWTASELSVGTWSFAEVAAAVVLPRHDAGVDAVFVATEGSERLVFRHQPFSSRAGLPDYTVWSDEGGVAFGYFDPEWAFDPALGVGP